MERKVFRNILENSRAEKGLNVKIPCRSGRKDLTVSGNIDILVQRFSVDETQG